MRYLFLRENVLFMVNIRFHLPKPHWTPFDVYTKYVFIMAVYKSGTGTRGRGHRDACVGTWDLGTRDEGLEDIKYGTRGRVGRGRGGVKNRDAGDAGCE